MIQYTAILAGNWPPPWRARQGRAGLSSGYGPYRPTRPVGHTVMGLTKQELACVVDLSAVGGQSFQVRVC